MKHRAVLAHCFLPVAPLLETHDPPQSPQKGGLLYAKYGRRVHIKCLRVLS